MTPEELLKPRYIVIADYPEIERHNIKIGDVITTEATAMYADKIQDGTPVVAIDHEIFPAIFKKLEWWEEREEEDMPDYVKMSRTNEVFHVDGRNIRHEFSAMRGYFGLKYQTGGGTYIGDGEPRFLPATKEEYENYKL